MDRVIQIFALVAGLGMALFCMFCALEPDSVAARVRRRHQRSSKLLQKWPFAKMVMKPWYPTYLRVMGLFGFLFMLGWLYAVAIQFRR